LTAGASDEQEGPKTGFQRTVAAVRSALPFIQKLLPLLDGNFASTVTALLAPVPQQYHPPPPPPQVKIDLEPVSQSLAELRQELQSGQRELRSQVMEQVTALKRVEDQLERVREATDRNTLEQQEMVEDLRSVGNRVSTLAIAGVVLLVISLGLNVYFLIQLQHILR
jgi:vacuolar-type H+-ATPase subunit I/STV1